MLLTIIENQLIMSDDVLNFATDEEILQLQAICRAIKERKNIHHEKVNQETA